MKGQQVFTDAELAQKHITMKELWKGGKITCECGNVYFKNSEQYHGHMLFVHGFLVPQCSTKQVKQLQDNCIKGFAKRDEVRAEKKKRQEGLGDRRRQVKHYFRQFWENVNSSRVEVNEVRIL